MANGAESATAKASRRLQETYRALSQDPTNITQLQLPSHTRAWVLSKVPANGESPLDFFKLVEKPLPATPANGFIVKPRYFSNDPAQRTWLNQRKSYVEPIRVGEAMRAGGVGEIVASNNADFKIGDYVYGAMTWSEYVVIENTRGFQKLTDEEVQNQEQYLAQALTALTAYFGLLHAAEATPKDKTVVVSGAAGATGHIVIQIAKLILKIPNVIGIAGSEEKCNIIKSLGCDAALNYKSPTFAVDLATATPNGIDVYFDNVGGSVLDAALNNMSNYGRIAACGSISGYNDTKVRAAQVYGWYEIISKRLKVKGFIVLDYLSEFEKAQKEINAWVREGKIKPLNTVFEAKFEDVPKGMEKLLAGSNTGKFITKIVD